MEPLRGEDPRRIGRYTLVSRLGSGGMGQVFLGFSPAGRPVAVKVVHPELARDRAFLSRFRQEVAAARKVSGAYTAAVVDAGDGDPPWLATTLVVGPSLADAVEQLGPLPEVSVWRLAAGLAEALAEVHSCGLVHRDLKPSNVLLATDGPRVIDFGISRALDGTGMTGTGMLVGTPGFMSPEQASGEPVGPASDVFSFGGVVAFAATGSGPFGDEGTPVAVMYRVVHGEPELAGLPGALPGLVARCLTKLPGERSTVAELMEIITANLTPVTSATAFWPEALAEFIRSCQARFTADAPAWPATVTASATPPATARPAGPAGSAEGHPATEVALAGGSQDGPATVTTERASVTLAPSASDAAPPTVASPQVAPPEVAPPRGSPPWWRRRGALAGGIGALVAALVAVVIVLATSSPGPAPRATNPQPPGGFGAIPAENGTPHAGTLSFEQPGGSPTWILPISTATNNTVDNIDYFDYEMWRPLYWPAKGVSPTIDPALSLARPPVWSNGGTTVTVTMNPSYKWSDGNPVSAQDVAFDIHLIKAAVAENPQNWSNYNPGSFPDDLASMSTPNQSTLVLNLTSPVNPSWFYQDELQYLQPMPAQAWAKASANGPILDFTNPGNAKKIYDYLVTQSNAMATWARNTLWQVVDGPYKLASFNDTTGAFTLAANPAYGGPDSHQIKAVNEIPFPTDAAVVKALQTGSVDVALIPSEYMAQVPRLRSAGYDVFGYPTFGYTDAIYNFKDTTGDFDHIVAQLYFRQAMAHLEDQQEYIRSFMDGAGSPAYGPVPPLPASPYAPDNSNNTYPFSLAAATSLLADNGWKVVPDGIDTCVRPGTAPGQCGAGIPAGTRLAFNLVYTSGAVLTKDQVTALAAEAKRAGIAITLTSSSFDEILADDNDQAAPGNAGKWAMADFGWTTQGPYPTTLTVFNSQGTSNYGGYDDPQADQLISSSVSSSDPNAVKNEAAYLTTQQPVLFQPNADQVFAWKKTLSGPPDSFANLTQSTFTPELWYFTKS